MITHCWQSVKYGHSTACPWYSWNSGLTILQLLNTILTNEEMGLWLAEGTYQRGCYDNDYCIDAILDSHKQWYSEWQSFPSSCWCTSHNVFALVESLCCLYRARFLVLWRIGSWISFVDHFHCVVGAGVMVYIKLVIYFIKLFVGRERIAVSSS